MVQTLTVFEIDPYEFCEEEFDRADADLSGHFDRHAAPFAVLLRTWEGRFPSKSEPSSPRGTALPFTVHDFFLAGHDLTREMREHGCERNRSAYSHRPAWDHVNEMVKELLWRDILPISFHDDNREFVVVMTDANGMGTAPLLRIVNVEPCPCHPRRSSPHFRWILNSWPCAEYRSPMDLMVYGLGYTETDSDEDDSDEDESVGYDSELEPDTTDDFNLWMVFRPELSRQAISAVIESMESIDITSISSNDMQCAICYLDFDKTDPEVEDRPVRLPCCRQLVGGSCLTQVLQDLSTRCPFCRREIIEVGNPMTP